MHLICIDLNKYNYIAFYKKCTILHIVVCSFILWVKLGNDAEKSGKWKKTDLSPELRSLHKAGLTEAGY